MKVAAQQLSISLACLFTPSGHSLLGTLLFGDSESGSSAWLRQVRLQCWMEREKANTFKRTENIALNTVKWKALKAAKTHDTPCSLSRPTFGMTLFGSLHFSMQGWERGINHVSFGRRSLGVLVCGLAFWQRRFLVSYELWIFGIVSVFLDFFALLSAGFFSFFLLVQA